MIKPPSANFMTGSTNVGKNPPKLRPIDVLSGGVPNMTGSVGLRPVIGSMHDGGEVEKDGAYELEAGETVTPAPKEKEESEEITSKTTNKVSAESAGYMELNGAKKDGDCKIVQVEGGISKDLGCCNLFKIKNSKVQKFDCGHCHFED